MKPPLHDLLRMPAVPFKANAARRHRIPKQRHRVTNWAEYDAGLRQRGSLTVCFTEEAIAAWPAAPRTSRGGQPWCSPLAILTAPTLAGRVPLGPAPDRGTDWLDPARAQARACRTGPHHAQPPGQNPGSAAATVGKRARAPSGGQHGTEAVWPGRMAGRDARDQETSVLEEAASRRRCRHRPDRRVGADRQRGRRWRKLARCSTRSRARSPRSPPTACSTGTMYIARSPPDIPMRRSSCPRARARCRTTWLLLSRRSVISISSASSSTAAGAGRTPRDTTGVP